MPEKLAQKPFCKPKKLLQACLKNVLKSLFASLPEKLAASLPEKRAQNKGSWKLYRVQVRLDFAQNRCFISLFASCQSFLGALQACLGAPGPKSLPKASQRTRKDLQKYEMAELRAWSWMA